MLDAALDFAPAPTRSTERATTSLSFVIAAAAHLAVLVAILPSRGDSLGDDGVTLETIAVSLVDSVPVFSAPETAASDAGQPATEAADKPVEARPEEPPTPPTQSLALDLPPEFVPPEAIALPVRAPDATPQAETVVRDDSPAEKHTETAVAAPPPQSSAAAILPSVSSGEASSGVVRAYAGTISKVLDRQKPRSGGRTGKVQVQFVIDTAGKSAVPVVLASSGNQRLDEIVVEAIQRMDFPAPPPQMSERQRTFKVPFAFR